MTSETPKCPDEATLDSLVRGELETGAATRLEQHLEGCTSCREALAEFRLTEEYGDLLRDSRERFDPELRRQVIRTATEVCRDRVRPD